MLAGSLLDEADAGLHLQGAVRRLGEPVIRTAVAQAMREMGRQFVLGQDIHAAHAAAPPRNEKRGLTYSYDMLGEAAMTAEDADRYARAYRDAIAAIAAGLHAATTSAPTPASRSSCRRCTRATGGAGATG